MLLIKSMMGGMVLTIGAERAKRLTVNPLGLHYKTRPLKVIIVSFVKRKQLSSHRIIAARLIRSEGGFVSPVTRL